MRERGKSLSPTVVAVFWQPTLYPYFRTGRYSSAATSFIINNKKEIEVFFQPTGEKTILLDGKRIAQSKMNELVKVLWITPQMDRLWTSGASDRRNFIDRLIYSKNNSYIRQKTISPITQILPLIKTPISVPVLEYDFFMYPSPIPFEREGD